MHLTTIKDVPSPELPTGVEREHFEQEATEIIETVSLGWICIVRNNERPRVVIVRSDGDGALKGGTGL